MWLSNQHLAGWNLLEHKMGRKTGTHAVAILHVEEVTPLVMDEGLLPDVPEEPQITWPPHSDDKSQGLPCTGEGVQYQLGHENHGAEPTLSVCDSLLL